MLYDALHTGWPRSTSSKPVDNCAPEVRAYCAEHGHRCDHERQVLAREWKRHVRTFEEAHLPKACTNGTRAWIMEKRRGGVSKVSNVTIPDVAIHVRKGDSPRHVNQTYAPLIRALYPRSVHLFSENAHEADEVYTQVRQANVPAEKIHIVHSMSTVC